MACHHKEKAQQLATRAQEFKATAKAAKCKILDWFDQHFRLLNLVTPRGGEIMLMPNSDAERLGERKVPQPTGGQQGEASAPKCQRFLERTWPAESQHQELGRGKSSAG
jgi:hypothetical protein